MTQRQNGMRYLKNRWRKTWCHPKFRWHQVTRHLFSSVRHLFSTLSYSLRTWWHHASQSVWNVLLHDRSRDRFWLIHMNVSILFRPKNRTQDNFFELFAKLFWCLRPRGNLFNGPKFSNFSWQRCDSFGPKIVEIGAVLAIFQPFESSKKFAGLRFT